MESPRRSQSVLLAHSYYLRYDEKQLRKMKPYPPLATLLAAAVLRERRFEVRVFDAMLSDGVQAFYTLLEELRPGTVALVEDNFNFLTKMCTVRMRNAALDMIRRAKALACRVVVNGSDASDHPGLYLDAGADAVIAGEPEQALVELLDAWSSDRDAPVDHIAGLVIAARDARRRGVTACRSTDPRPFIRDLDSLPFPAWDLVDVQRYRRAWTAAHGRLSWNLVTSRGCPYRCNWCAKPLFGTRYAQRSAANVVTELRRLKGAVNPDHIWFADDIFGLTSSWIEEFARQVIDQDASIPFTMQSRVNLMKPGVVAALARAGAEEVWLGVESGSQRILDAMDKGTKVEQIRLATRALKAHGIRSCWFIQLGYVGETWEDVLLTRDLIRDERPDDIGVSVAYPLPGTGFYDQVKRQLGPKTNWTDSGDLAMMFQGTYVTPFYKAVRSLLHAEVDASPTARPGTRRRFDDQWARLEREEPAYRSQHPTVPVG